MNAANMLSVILTLSAVASPAGNTKAPPPGQASIDFGIGGCGGVYFLAEPGELTVDLEKCDRGRKGRRTELRAILAGPDRKVLQEVTLRDGVPSTPGRPGQTQTARLSTHVVRKGVYVLNITASQDRYGDTILWGFRTNCRRYLIETSRGHRDERHQEPLVLRNPNRPGDVGFLPRAGAFGIEVTGLPAGTDALSVFDDRNGRLFLSYDYWSTYWFYRTDHAGSRRAVLMSPDGGDTWKLAENEDLAGP